MACDSSFQFIHLGRTDFTHLPVVFICDSVSYRNTRKQICLCNRLLLHSVSLWKKLNFVIMARILIRRHRNNCNGIKTGICCVILNHNRRVRAIKFAVWNFMLIWKIDTYYIKSTDSHLLISAPPSEPSFFC